ncbi:HRDC domain-containing protein [Corynebacterium sp. TA-R-1]|uniref:HRDC domain-containing protein n=1 Tax=Corynebacterium stercoris TaxID=2943490 RepID=A0ABT1FZR3_9CORY|nr:HRDC domain-containing protein [Corynebacterium stercoris]
MTQHPDYTLVDSPAGFRRAAQALEAGRGPFAVDTERASAYRYDDRAFLVQVHRRGAGTFLFAPEGHRDAVRDALEPVLGGADWIIHAAGEDLASLALLGLHPATLFDTELAARLAGFDRPNLGAMVEHYTGTHLEKGHGREDWSLTPLPADWLDYAALDVLYLNDLAEALAEELAAAGMLAAAEQEFAHLIRTRSLAPAQPKTWRDMKGVQAVRSPAGLQIARALWQERDAAARHTDASPAALLQTKVIVAVAQAQPGTPDELARVPGFPARKRGATSRWFGVVEAALRERRQAWPERTRRDPHTPPSKPTWERTYPESFAALEQARTRVAAAAGNLGIRPEDLLSPATLREVMWSAAARPLLDAHDACRRLLAAGAREWQAEIAGPLLVAPRAAED